MAGAGLRIRDQLPKESRVMKGILLTGALLFAVPALAGDVGVSITVGQPGFFGQINIGDVPLPQPPQLVYARPVVIRADPRYGDQPIYLHVPPGHEKHWSRHCAEYHACGRPVYFVRDDWYNREYVPRYAHRDDRDGRGEGHDRDHDRDHDRGRGHDHDRGHDRDDDHDH
jgi:hypothetical protein